MFNRLIRTSYEDKKYMIIILVMYLIGAWWSINNGYMDIRSDGLRYYAHLRTVFVDGNLDFYEEENYYHYARYLFQEVRPRNRLTGKRGNFTQLGWALFCSPWFLLGRVTTYALYWLGYPVYLDGYEWPEIMFSTFGSSFYSFLAVILVYRLVRYFFTPSVSFWSTVGIWWGSGWLYYMLVRPSYSHAIAGFIVTLLLFYSYRHLILSTPSRSHIFVLGIILGLTILVRLQMILWGLVPVLLLFRYHAGNKSQAPIKRIQALAWDIGLLAITCFSLFTLQMFEWKQVYGSWFLIPQGSDFLQFSWEKGRGGGEAGAFHIYANDSNLQHPHTSRCQTASVSCAQRSHEKQAAC